ncbi:MAG: Tetratricopeptide 2 repeat protein [Verrucomicrobia bacterium]|nr:Tetratricopeptide 2 repeat protein [Verrucomicrobiota bacterium]
MTRALAVLLLLVVAGCATRPPPAPAKPKPPVATTPIVPVDLPPPPPAPNSHLDFRREAAAAHDRHDYPAYLAATQGALRLRPDSPRYLYDLAGAYALMGRTAEAFDALRRLIALGVVMPLEEGTDLAPLRKLPPFKGIRVSMHKNSRPRGAAGPLFDLNDRTGIIEGIAYRTTTQDYLLSDVHEHCIWRSLPDGTIKRFTAPDTQLLGVFKLLADEPHGLLWASTSARPEMEGYTAELKGRSELVSLQLASGKVIRRYPLPVDGRDHCLGDFIAAPDGTIYVTDSVAPIIWRLSPGQAQLEKFIESNDFKSLQGIGFLANRTKLVVTDYPNGISVIDLKSKQITPVPPPPRTTFLGLDGFMVEGDTLFAVQNGVNPERIVRLKFAPTFDRVLKTDVLASGQENFADLAQFTMVDGWIMVVTRSGWADFEDAQGQPAKHAIHVMTVNAH